MASETPLSVPNYNISEIKNKQLRGQMYRKMKVTKKKMKMDEKKRKLKEEKETGVKAPKQVPKTIESMRIPDETMVDPEDEEVKIDESLDEMASYFNRSSTPKILLTTSARASFRTQLFCRELKRVIPNIDFKHRRDLNIKKIVPQALSHDFTDIIIVHCDRGIPNGLVISHLPDGPTAHYKLSSVKLTKEIKRAGDITEHRPELILNNFNTRLGHSVGRLFASLFPHDPEFRGRRAITFHNQRDYIFFRHHRYVFRNEKRVGLHELGPRFTLKLRTLQKGTFDSRFGEYEFIHKRHEMDTSRRKFFL